MSGWVICNGSPNQERYEDAMRSHCRGRKRLIEMLLCYGYPRENMKECKGEFN